MRVVWLTCDSSHFFFWVFLPVTGCGSLCGWMHIRSFHFHIKDGDHGPLSFLSSHHHQLILSSSLLSTFPAYIYLTFTLRSSIFAYLLFLPTTNTSTLNSTTSITMADQINTKLTPLPTYNTNIPEQSQQASAVRIIQPANGNPGPLGLFAFAVTTSTFISIYSSMFSS